MSRAQGNHQFRWCPTLASNMPTGVDLVDGWRREADKVGLGGQIVLFTCLVGESGNGQQLFGGHRSIHVEENSKRITHLGDTLYVAHSNSRTECGRFSDVIIFDDDHFAHSVNNDSQHCLLIVDAGFKNHYRRPTCDLALAKTELDA